MENLPYETQIIKSGTPIVTEDTWAYFVYVILSGRAKVVKTIEGEEEILGNLKEGDVVGELSVIGRGERTASVVADGDVEVAVIPGSNVLNILDHLTPDMQSKLNLLTTALSHVTQICATCEHLLHEIERLKKRVDLDHFNKELSSELHDIPDIYQQIFMTLVKRLNVGIETLTKFSSEVKTTAGLAKSVSAGTR